MESKCVMSAAILKTGGYRTLARAVRQLLL